MHELSRVITSRASYRPRFPNLFIGKLGGGRLSYPYGERYEAIASLMKASAHDRNKPVWRPFHFIDHLLNTNQFEREWKWEFPRWFRLVSTMFSPFSASRPISFSASSIKCPQPISPLASERSQAAAVTDRRQT